MSFTPSQFGLTRLSTDQLKRALKLIYQQRLPCPLSRVDLLSRGLNPLADFGDSLFGLDERATCAILSAVLAERQRYEGQLETLRGALERAHANIDRS
jgi:hypothetical protein